MATATANVEEQIQSLRIELKEWEHGFAAGNDGRKPTKTDVKGNPGIGSL